MSDQHPWLSIVTVVKDDPSGFDATARSIGDGLEGIEWLVIDSSSDTADIRKRFDAAPSATTKKYHWVPPAGVYPAMNFGLTEATGEYVYFLNAGDSLHAPTVLNDVKAALATRPAWLFGQVRFVRPDGRATIPPPFDFDRELNRRFAAGRFPPHQGTIARRRLLRKWGGFDERYAVAADYLMCLRLSSEERPVQVPFVLADFSVGGLSAQAWRLSLREFHAARVEAFGLTGRARWGDGVRTLWQGTKIAVARGIKRT